MVTTPVTFSTSLRTHLTQAGVCAPQEVDRLTQLASALEARQRHVTELDHGDFVTLATALDTLKSLHPYLADWAETFADDWNRRVHARSNC